jgi:hypothetical protein
MPLGTPPGTGRGVYGSGVAELWSPGLSNGAPHRPQNRFSRGLAAPHDGHAECRGVPHSPQNFIPARLSAWHREHLMPGLHKAAPGGCTDIRQEPSPKPSTVQVLPALTQVCQRRDAAAGDPVFLRKCDRPHITALHPVVSPRTIEWSNSVGEFAVISRKPAFVRWAEEAEAKQVCERAEIERACDRPDINTERPRGSCDRQSLLGRLRGLFGSRVAEIERDG